ncbi:MAG: hypothetical protein Q4G28_01150 [Neisseria sp.]|nr:hypothetical protein [Neisseria sp.]
MTDAKTNRMPDPAQLMEAEESALVSQERCDDFLERRAVAAEQAEAEAEAAPLAEQAAIQPQVEVNTDDISECHAFTPADEMEAEERELVIEDSVDDVRTYAQQPLSDEEIRARAITQPEQIHPNPKDGSHC